MYTSRHHACEKRDKLSFLKCLSLLFHASCIRIEQGRRTFELANFFKAIHYLRGLWRPLLYPQTILVLSQSPHYSWGKLYNFKFNYSWKVGRTFMNVQSVPESRIASRITSTPIQQIFYKNIQCFYSTRTQLYLLPISPQRNFNFIFCQIFFNNLISHIFLY